MRRHQGATKRRAPSSDPETCCPHEYIDEDELVLSVDCDSCAGAHDLENQRCFAGIINALATGAQPDSIVLKRYTHKRYRGDMVRCTVSSALELAALRRGLAALEIPSDRRCRTCPASAQRVLLQAKLRITESPIRPPADRASLADDILESIGDVSCDRASTCVMRALQGGI